jgi:multiple sugar transport system ATP-binding protein
MNVVKASVKTEADKVSVALSDGGAFAFPSELPNRLGAGASDLTIGVRPEGVLVSREAATGFVPVEAHIIEPLGAYDIVDLKVGNQLLRARTQSGFVARPGDTVWARLDPAQTHFFNTGNGQSLQIRLGDGASQA